MPHESFHPNATERIDKDTIAIATAIEIANLSQLILNVNVNGNASGAIDSLWKQE